MKALKRISGFYISIGVLGVALVASAYFYKKEADKVKTLGAEVETARDNLSGLRIKMPTEKHRQFVEKQRGVIQENFQKIVQQVLRWNYVPPEEWTPPRFLGKLSETRGMIILAASALDRKIRIDPKAEYLGFDEYKVTPPRPGEEDIIQLQRELSAATDIAQLLIASNVHTISYMARRDSALMEEGASNISVRVGMEATTGRRARTRVKADLYDTVPFRVRFTCTYPALAQFMRALVTPGKITVKEFGQTLRRPRNFLLINDFWYTVPGEREQDRDLRREDARARAAKGMGGIIPEDFPDAVSWYSRNRPEALAFFAIWRAYSPEEKKIYLLRRRLSEQIAAEERERVQAEFDRTWLEYQKRLKYKGEARPPGYNLIEVTMLIDFVQFNEKLLAEAQPKDTKTKATAGSTTTASN
ncbi:MAG: Amuc_1100 family pilus-like protein [bacterium]|nr:Amuc_1100 family pilus-like protein [bacterium]